MSQYSVIVETGNNGFDSLYGIITSDNGMDDAIQDEAEKIYKFYDNVYGSSRKANTPLRVLLCANASSSTAGHNIVNHIKEYVIEPPNSPRYTAVPVRKGR